MIAAAGVVLVDQGHEWVVAGFDDGVVVAAQGSATRRFHVGTQVVTAGRQRGALQVPAEAVAPESVWAYDELRRFREGARQGKPAYVVFDDKTLVAIADALPDDARRPRPRQGRRAVEARAIRRCGACSSGGGHRPMKQV